MSGSVLASPGFPPPGNEEISSLPVLILQDFEGVLNYRPDDALDFLVATFEREQREDTFSSCPNHVAHQGVNEGLGREGDSRKVKDHLLPISDSGTNLLVADLCGCVFVLSEIGREFHDQDRHFRN